MPHQRLLETSSDQQCVAVPRALAAHLKSCRISLPPRLMNPALTSQWVETNRGLEIDVATEGIGGHELAMELLLCLGQALWETSGPGDRGGCAGRNRRG